MTFSIVDNCPTCGAKRTRQIKADKALVAFSPTGSALVLEHTKEGYLDQAVRDKSSWASEIFDLEDLVPEEALMIWEGKCFFSEENELQFTGKFRPLSMDEWKKFKQGQPLLG